MREQRGTDERMRPEQSECQMACTQPEIYHFPGEAHHIRRPKLPMMPHTSLTAVKVIVNRATTRVRTRRT